MKPSPKSLLLSALLVAIATLPGPSAFAADASPAPQKVSKFPFHGKLKSVDPAGMTFTLDGKTPRVFAVIADTKIKKNDQPATLKDATVGDDVGGYTERDASGKLTALTVHFGPHTGKPEATPAATVAGPAANGITASAPAPSATPKAKRTKKKAKASPSPSASPATASSGTAATSPAASATPKAKRTKKKAKASPSPSASAS